MEKTLVIPRKMPLAMPAILRHRRSCGRFRTCDTSFTFRMGAGFPGDVNRGHPASIQPCAIDQSAPPSAYGQAVLVDPTTQGVRPLTTGDYGATEIWGVTARPYPLQQPSAPGNNYGEQGYGTITPPALQPIDVLRGGYILVPVVGAPVKGGPVFVWCAVSGGGHTQGGFEAGGGGGNNTAALDTSYMWNSPPDANGIAELICSKY